MIWRRLGILSRGSGYATALDFMLPLSARSPQARLCAISNIVFTDHPMAFSLLKMYFRMVFLSLPVGLLAEDPMRQEGGGKDCRLPLHIEHRHNMACNKGAA